jgi:ankyrin repeat protein
MTISPFKTPRSKEQWREAILSSDSAVAERAIGLAQLRIASNALTGLVGWLEESIAVWAFEALEAADVAMLGRLVRTGFPLDRLHERKNQPTTLLISASVENNIAAVRVLLDAGANPNASDTSRDTALLWAASKGHVELSRLLLDKGAFATHRSMDGINLLHAAALGGSIEICEDVLRLGLELESRCNLERTALHWSVENQHLECTRFLLDAGSSIDAQDAERETALHLCKDKEIALLEFLLTRNPSLDLRCAGGATALQKAAASGNVQCAKRLIAAGANPMIDDNQGNSPLHALCLKVAKDQSRLANPVADEAELVAVAKLILDLGVSPNYRNEDSMTPLGLAREAGCVPLIHLLESFGAVP